MPSKRRKRDTYLYRLKDGRKTVYIGKTKNPEKRLKQHKGSGKRFRKITTSFPSSSSTARKNEKKALKNYKKNHGRLPRYNKRP